MLIIYPAPNWNSFGKLTDLIAGMEFQFPTYAEKFKKLDPKEQNAVAANAGLWMRTCEGLTIPTPNHTVPQDIVLAQIAIMASTYGRDPLAYDYKESAITSEKVGSLAVTYDVSKLNSMFDINPLIYRLLAPYGCTSGAGGFSQSRIHKA